METNKWAKINKAANFSLNEIGRFFDAWWRFLCTKRVPVNQQNEAWEPSLCIILRGDPQYQDADKGQDEASDFASVPGFFEVEAGVKNDKDHVHGDDGGDNSGNPIPEGWED